MLPDNTQVTIKIESSPQDQTSIECILSVSGLCELAASLSLKSLFMDAGQEQVFYPWCLTLTFGVSKEMFI